MILAEEEFAKAFLLYLIQEQALPSTPEVWRSLRDHECKHLLTILMEYLSPTDDQFDSRLMNQFQNDDRGRLPREVASAVNLYRYQKISSWESPSSSLLESGDYDGKTKRLPGRIDRAKQRGFYVDVEKDGRVLTTPSQTREGDLEQEREKCSRLHELATQIESGYVLLDRDFTRVKTILAFVFSPRAITDEDTLIPGVIIVSELVPLATLDDPSKEKETL